jgi:DNA-binding SARP family transcriptional activator/tetratricopeptide (TPR) repeat protein
MAIAMEFGLLGPLVVRCDGAFMAVSRSRERAVLAALLLHANEVVPIDDLAEALWGELPPPSAAMTVRNYVKRLRHVLGDAGGSRIGTGPGGYSITVEAGELDIARFERLASAVRSAVQEGNWDQVNRQASAALSLWRGEPLADAGSRVLSEREAPRLTEMRLQVLEALLDAEVRSGGHARVVPELYRLVHMYPLREHLHATLMLALYRCGRQGDALSSYRNARQVLVAELGVEPGPGLQELHRRVLAADPSLAGTEPARAAETGTGQVTPRELPPTVYGFTGRLAEFLALSRLLDRSGAAGGQAIVISAIGGTAGVGKTALAVHWAHQVADRFPDGQLYVNLRGYDPGPPVPAADALAGFLTALGVAGPDIPPGQDRRAARYRSLLADKQMLVLLDNAGSADQVRPLLPGTGTCTVLVTSRDALAGLVARDGAISLDLGALPPREAVTLLRRLIGARVDAEPGAAAVLADQCCRLPLALRVAAELAATRPSMSLAGLTAELADLRTRLDLLDAGGDPSAQVRAVFSWSYRHLDADTARTFRLLGLHPGPDFDLYATAAIAGTAVPQARRAVCVLARSHLLSAASPGRHGMHDLLRGYACELAAAESDEAERQAALTRLFSHYLHTAAVAMNILLPAERHRRPRIPQPATPVPPLADPAAARDWLERERAALVAAVAYTAAHGWPGLTTRLATTISSYLENGHFPEAMTVFSHALNAARRTGDRAAEAMALRQIGGVEGEQSRFRQAADHNLQALALFREIGDRAGEAFTLGSAGLDEMQLGHYEQAARHQQEAAAIHRDLGDRFGEKRALGNLGLVRLRQGRYREATAYYQQSLELSRQIGDRQGEALALGRLGAAELRLGRYEHATGYFEQSRALLHETGDKAEFEVLVQLGQVYLALGNHAQAASNFEQSLAVSREIGIPALESDALNGLGDVLLQTGKADQARAHHATALLLASQTGEPRALARAHASLARSCQADGDTLAARHHWQEALTRYAAIGAPETDDIRARLTPADSQKGLPGQSLSSKPPTTM